MPMTSVDLPTELVALAKAATGQTTTKGAITAALQLTVDRARQRDAISALAGMDFLADLAEPGVAADAAR